MLRCHIILLSALLVCVFGLAGCSRSADTTVEPPDASGIVWLCRPGLAHDPCTASLKTTVVGENGSKRIVDYEPAHNPSIDCFYVYPNVTHQQTDNANLDIDPQESAIAELEASQFSRSCRVYAPIYREDSGDSSGQGPYQIALDSVEAAWTDYIEHYNDGRGFVLIGHSEGTGLLGHLIIDRIEHNPIVRQRLVSALLIGGNLPVRTNGLLLFKDQQIQPCRLRCPNGLCDRLRQLLRSTTLRLDVWSAAECDFGRISRRNPLYESCLTVGWRRDIGFPVSNPATDTGCRRQYNGRNLRIRSTDLGNTMDRVRRSVLSSLCPRPWGQCSDGYGTPPRPSAHGCPECNLGTPP